MNEKEFRIELQKAVEVLKPSIVKASDQYPADVLVSAMIELGMRLSLLKYGSAGLISLVADILHTTATSGELIDELKVSGHKTDSDVMRAFNTITETETTH